MGDLNTGPATESFPSEEPDSWSLVAAEGWSNPFADLVGSCTYRVADNLLLDESSEDRLIDHVLVDGDFVATSAERMLDTPTTAESCGETRDVHPSDHVGVRVAFDPRAP